LQIARIVATTTVGPVGYLTAGEDGALTKNEEYAPKDWTEGAGAEAWCHQRPHLKKQGVLQMDFWGCTDVPGMGRAGKEERGPSKKRKRGGKGRVQIYLGMTMVRRRISIVKTSRIQASSSR
jgi:hypothetical protein